MQPKKWFPKPDEVNEYGVKIMWSQLTHTNDAVVPVVCRCGNQRIVHVEHLLSYKGKGLCRFCVKKEFMTGKNHPAWKGGISINWCGYRTIRINTLSPEDQELVKPMMNSSNVLKEHRVIMAHILGRPLTHNETVHHLNGNKLDNQPENLLLISNSEHQVVKTRQLQWALDEIERLRSILRESHIPF